MLAVLTATAALMGATASSDPAGASNHPLTLTAPAEIVALDLDDIHTSDRGTVVASCATEPRRFDNHTALPRWWGVAATAKLTRVISSVRGTDLDVGLDQAVVEVGGIGLAVRTTPAVLAQLHTGTEATLATVLMVREDALTLYGFSAAVARELFLLLQTVPGIGPRVALATPAVLTPDQLRHALASEEITTLTRVPGIGRKGAERLIIELRDRVAPTPGAAPPTTTHAGAGARTGARDHVVQAKVGLGFTAQNADHAVTAVTADQPADSPLDAMPCS